MDAAKVMKSSQEQAVAAWVNYLNQLRLDELVTRLAELDLNRDAALEELRGALEGARSLIVSNRGAERGMHGFLAEIAEKGIHNARRLIDGNPADMTWVNDNGPVDLIVGNTPLQQKFYRSAIASLDAANRHLKAYPDFLRDGGKYQIPNDQCQALKYLGGLSQEEAYKSLSATTSPTIGEWRKVNALLGRSNVSLEDLEPAKIDYAQAQKGAVEKTFEGERKSLLKKDRKRRDAACERSKPSVGEGAKATLVSAGIEGTAAFVASVASKVRAGKSVKDFSSEDWADAFGELGKGSAKGAVRGASIYVLTNFTATPAAVASSVVTASFSVVDLVHRYRVGELTEQELIKESQIACLDASVSAVSSLVGQTLIPVPVVGAVIGNTVGMVMYGAAKDVCGSRERASFEAYAAQQAHLEASLQERYARRIELLNEDMASFLGLLADAFVPDTCVALEGSIELARHLGVADAEILKDVSEIDNFFLA